MKYVIVLAECVNQVCLTYKNDIKLCLPVIKVK